MTYATCDIQPVDHVVRELFAMNVRPKCQHVHQAKSDFRLRAVFQRNQFRTAIALDSRRQTFWITSIRYECVILSSREVDFGIQTVLEWIQRHSLHPTIDLSAQLRVQRIGQSQQQFELRIGLQTRWLIDVHAASSGDKIENSSPKEIRQIPELREG